MSTKGYSAIYCYECNSISATPVGSKEQRGIYKCTKCKSETLTFNVSINEDVFQYLFNTVKYISLYIGKVSMISLLEKETFSMEKLMDMM